MSSCVNCGRSIDTRGGLLTGPLLFCSPMCRDTSEELRRYQQMKAAETRLGSVCSACGLYRYSDEYHDCPADENAQAEREANRIALMRSHCGVPNCHVCSGAMRERKGDANG